MKNITLHILILFSGLLFSGVLYSCNKKTTETIKTTDSIPENAVPFEYDYSIKKVILIPGTLNDSIHLRYFLETGTRSVNFSDSLCNDSNKIKVGQNSYFVQQPMKVKIGQWEKIFGDSIKDAYYLDKNNSVLKLLGSDIAYLPWSFFDKKIIEISFSNKYIRELPNTDNLQNYDSVKIFIENGFLGIPVVVSVQGKKIRELLMFDTGFNRYIIFNNRIRAKYGIKPNNANGAIVDTLGFSVVADSIKIGKYTLIKEHRAGFASKTNRIFPFSGLIGTGIIQNFDIVLDLKNYYLYLKPIEKQ